MENVDNADGALIERLIYRGMSFDEYREHIEHEFIGRLAEGNYPPVKNDDGTDYLYKSTVYISYAVEYYNDVFVTVKYDDYYYYAAAVHGKPWTEYFLADIGNETLLSISDVLNPIPENILKDKIISSGQKVYSFTDNWPPDTVALRKDSVFLLWNVYTISSYAEGAIRIEIEDAVSDAYLTEKGKRFKRSME